MRQIVLDTETTGINPKDGHRIIEIGCVELVDRKPTGNVYHQYIQPEREVPQEAIDVHGITNEFLVDKPLFAQVAQEFFDFVKGAELIIHNAPFDMGFLNHEFELLNRGYPALEDVVSVLDTLVMAKELRPDKRNSLDALAKEYPISNRDRTYHGALLDSEILAEVYLAMTGGQKHLDLASDDGSSSDQVMSLKPIDRSKLSQLPVYQITAAERQAHFDKLESLRKASGDQCIFDTFKH